MISYINAHTHTHLSVNKSGLIYLNSFLINIWYNFSFRWAINKEWASELTSKKNLGKWKWIILYDDFDFTS
jgi:hypothetical protein